MFRRRVSPEDGTEGAEDTTDTKGGLSPFSIRFSCRKLDDLFVREEVFCQSLGNVFSGEPCDAGKRQGGPQEREPLHFQASLRVGECPLDEQVGDFRERSSADEVADRAAHDLDTIGFDPGDRGNPPSAPG